MGITTTFVDVDDGQIEVVVHDGDGWLVVMIPSAGRLATNW
ncbi:MAG: hypothetical protein ABIP17_15650 [Ilumatobacteraceae bacterium]